MDAEKLKSFFLDKSRINYLIPILIIVLYLCLLLLPKIKQTFLLLPKVAQLQAKIINIEKEWTNIDSFREKISRLNEKIDYYEKKLPGEKEVPAVLEYLSDSAKEMDVRITEIKPIEQDSAATPSLYYRVPILLKAECGYHQLGRFLNKLERADRFTKINDIKMTASRRNSGIHNVQLIVVTYVMEK